MCRGAAGDHREILVGRSDLVCCERRGGGGTAGRNGSARRLGYADARRESRLAQRQQRDRGTGRRQLRHRPADLRTDSRRRQRAWAGLQRAGLRRLSSKPGYN